MYETQIAAGIALLDQYHETPNWVWDIPTDDRLDLRSCHTCVLGFDFKEYGRGLKALNLTESSPLSEPALDAANYGFNLPWGSGSRAQWDNLTREWRKALLARRKELECTATASAAAPASTPATPATSAAPATTTSTPAPVLVSM